MVGGKSSRRKELFDPLNFAAFYLHELFPAAARVLYLDTDVVVLANLVDGLSRLNLHGQPAGVVEDCSQRLGKYVDMEPRPPHLCEGTASRGGSRPGSCRCS